MDRRFVDCHSHVVPSGDDGAATIQDGLALCASAAQHGTAVLFATPEADQEADSIRALFAENGAETLDAARESFWVGIRDAEKLHYESAGPSAPFHTVEGAYRRGYVAGLSGVASEQGTLRDDAEKDAYRRGFDRGQAQARPAVVSAGR